MKPTTCLFQAGTNAWRSSKPKALPTHTRVPLKPSISDVSIKVEKGEFVLITGPSGCGKTTLCRTFNGLIPQFYQGELKGEITVAGLDAAKHPTYEMAKHVGLVFQNPENQLFALKR